MVKQDKKRGLGRGLSALMSDVVVDNRRDVEEPAAAVETLPIEWVQPNPDQPRKQFSQVEMDELIASVREKGIIQPLIVRKLDEEVFQIVAGERRWRAAQAVSLHEVPVVVRSFTDTEVLEIAIIENIQRADLNPIEEAAGYRQLMDRFGHTQEKLAEALGKSRSHIANLMRLLQLPGSVQALVQAGKLSAGHARALITCDQPEALAKKVVEQGLSVRATEALVKKVDTEDKSATRPSTQPDKDADTRALEGDLSAALGMKVTLAHAPGAESGVMTIRYESLDQLDELCQKLSG
jgi:ParB family chromosome partitioning protein